MADRTTTASNSCDQCGKSQDELQEPLKRCARCGGQKYCSKECQKQDWRNHRKVCGDPNSLVNPPKSEIVRYALQTVELMEALGSLPEYSDLQAEKAAPALLRDTFNFLAATLHNYFGELLQPQMTLDLICKVAVGGDVEKGRAEMSANLDRMERESGGEFDRNAWPPFDREKFTDGISRNLTACLTITDEPRAKQMYKMDPASQNWSFGDNVKAVAFGILGKGKGSKK